MADDSQLAEATQALSFAEFLERMKDPQAANLVKLIKTYGSPSRTVSIVDCASLMSDADVG